MSKNEYQLLSEDCPRCGGKLKRLKQKGSYICEYCGKSFFLPNLAPDDWDEPEEFAKDPVPIYDPPQETVDDFVDNHSFQTSRSSSPSRINLLIPIIAVISVCFTGLLIFFLFGGAGFLGLTSQTKNYQSDLEPTPEMVSTLPKAVRQLSSVAYSGWEMRAVNATVTKNNQIDFIIEIKSWNNAPRNFKFLIKDFVVYDDQGNLYSVSLGDCPPDSPYLERKIVFSARDEITFSSDEDWCDSKKGIPYFSGAVPPNARQIYLLLEQFGVFEDITLVFDL